MQGKHPRHCTITPDSFYTHFAKETKGQGWGELDQGPSEMWVLLSHHSGIYFSSGALWFKLQGAGVLADLLLEGGKKTREFWSSIEF